MKVMFSQASVCLSTAAPGRGWGYPLPPQIGQQNEHLLHGGRYASCVHAEGLSCSINVNIPPSRLITLSLCGAHLTNIVLSAICVVKDSMKNIYIILLKLQLNEIVVKYLLPVRVHKITMCFPVEPKELILTNIRRGTCSVQSIRFT